MEHENDADTIVIDALGTVTNGLMQGLENMVVLSSVAV